MTRLKRFNKKPKSLLSGAYYSTHRKNEMADMAKEEALIYIDGEFYAKSEAKVSVYDHGLLYGDGVFEGIRAYGGVVFKLKEHIDRLYDSAH